MTDGDRTSRAFLVEAVQSLGAARVAWQAAQAARRVERLVADDPLLRSYSCTMDALSAAVAAFIGALDEATVANQLIEYPHTHKLFEPVLIRRELLLAGQFLTAFELLMGSVVGQLRASYYTDATPAAEREEQEGRYATSVVALDKSVLRASCLWLRDHGALGDDDIAVVDRIRRRRNDIAHRLPALLFTKSWYVPLDEFRVIAGLVAKVDLWWLRQSGATEPRSWTMVLLEFMLESVVKVDLGDASPLTAASSGEQEARKDEEL